MARGDGIKRNSVQKGCQKDPWARENLLGAGVVSAHWQRGSLEHATLIGPRLLHLQMSTSGNGDLGM